MIISHTNSLKKSTDKLSKTMLYANFIEAWPSFISVTST